jgi:hypothetical protein
MPKGHGLAALDAAGWSRGSGPAIGGAELELAQLKEAIATTRAEPACVAMVQCWMGRVADLKRRLEQTPDQKIPEFRFLTEQDWLNATRGQLDTDTDYRKSMAALREAAQGKFADLACNALRLYLKGRDPRLDFFSQPYAGDWRQLLVKQFPADLAQLQPYLIRIVGGAESGQEMPRFDAPFRCLTVS